MNGAGADREDPAETDQDGAEPGGRTPELAANLTAVRRRIALACAAAGRDPAEVTLIAVTKTYPAADVVRLVRLGVLEVGENRDQEAAAKATEVARVLAPAGAPRWHFLGQLQRNKCRSVVQYADLVHSVDSVRLAKSLAEAADKHRRGRPLEVLVQVSLDGDLARGGADEPGDLLQIAAAATAGGLVLRGVMAVAPLGQTPADAFARLREVAAGLRREYPTAVVISAGMSADLDPAIANGSTHVRVGTALLGKRPTLR